MLILLDIGNTAVTYGVYSQRGQTRKGHFGSDPFWDFFEFGSCQYNDVPKIIKNCRKSGGYSDTFDVVISSVVPKITKKIDNSLRGKDCHLWVAGANLPVPVKHRYPRHQKPGIDRLVSLYGASRLYKPPLLVIDFGTAVTFDYLSPKGVFEGGMIIPGPELSFQALIQRAALIPKTLRLPKRAGSFLGESTYDCLRCGILEGYGAMTDGLIERFKLRYGKKLTVVATGGFAAHLKPYTRRMKIVDPQHSIKSLLILFKDREF